MKFIKIFSLTTNLRNSNISKHEEGYAEHAEFFFFKREAIKLFLDCDEKFSEFC